MWVRAEVSDGNLQLTPAGVSRVVAPINGIRGRTSIRAGDIERVVDTRSGANGGLWFVLSNGTRFRLSRAESLVGSISTLLEPALETVLDRRLEEREQRRLMRSGARFAW